MALGFEKSGKTPEVRLFTGKFLYQRVICKSIMADTKILKPKIQASGMLEVFGVGVLKILSEKMLTPYVGNGTLKSAAVKGVLGGLAHSYAPSGFVRTITSGALLVDAGEDAAVSLMGMGGVDASEAQVGW